MKSCKILLSILLNVLSFFVNAQEFTKVGLELRFHLENATSNEMVPLLIEGQDNELEGIVNSFGGNIRLQIDQLYSIEIPASRVMEFSENERIKKIEFSKAPPKTMSDTMLIQTRADRVHQMAAPLRSKFSGKDVVLGVIDSGIELDHPDFQDSLGNTRILYVWDQRVSYDPNRQALGYTYGVEWDSASINNNTSTHDDNPAEFGHGSMVTGAAASNANATGNFKGVAPNVHIISVATDFSANNWLQTVAEAVDYIYKRADSLGLPCVINASIGTYLGSHDGEDIAARMIDQMIKAKSGRALVAAAGNAGQFNFHLQHQPNQDTVFSWFEYSSQLYSGQGGLYFQLWADTADMDQIQFAFGADRASGNTFEFRGRTAFDSIHNRLNTVHLDSIMSFSNNRLAYVYTYAEQSQGRYLMEVAIPQPDSTQYNFRFETSGQGKIDIWSALNITGTSNIIRINLPSVQQFPPIQKYVKSDSLQTIVSSFTCLPSVITVGNYTNRGTYIDVNNNQQNVGATPGQISPNSSLGPNRRGYLKPDISSAGDYMFAAGRLATMASTIITTPSKISQDSLHMRNGGTSMAAPTVAGMVALYLEQCPKANFNRIKNDLLSSSRTDAFSASAPDPKWGVGKADAFAYINQSQSGTQIVYSFLPEYCDGDTAYVPVLQGRVKYRWSNGDTNYYATVTQTDTLYARVFDGLCWGVSDTVSLLFKPSPPHPTLIQRNDSLISLDTGFYRWFLDGNLISHSNDSILRMSSTGYYQLELSYINNCTSLSDSIYYLATRLNEQNSTDLISIYPNPTENLVNLRVASFIEQAELIDQNGRRLLEMHNLAEGQLFQIEMSQWKKGIYFLQLSTPNGVYREKIIKW